jgi:Ca2+-binding RTX toxin-like protein
VRFKGTRGNDTLMGGIGNDTLVGLGGNDVLSGDGGRDTLKGGDGADMLDGGLGNDRLFGDEGNDRLTDRDGGSDSLYGGFGDDSLVIRREADTATDTVLLSGDDGVDLLSVMGTRQNQIDATLLGGAGDDILEAYFGVVNLDGGKGNDWAQVVAARSGTISMGAGNDELLLAEISSSDKIAAMMGSGNDRVTLIATSNETSYTVSLGTGHDTVTLKPFFGTAYKPSLTISDFQVGVGGDVLDLSDYVGTALTNYNGGDPFKDQHLRLVQSVNDTILQIDADGRGRSADWQTLTTFAKTDVAAFTSDNFGGYDPSKAAAMVDPYFAVHDVPSVCALAEIP